MCRPGVQRTLRRRCLFTHDPVIGERSGGCEPNPPDRCPGLCRRILARVRHGLKVHKRADNPRNPTDDLSSLPAARLGYSSISDGAAVSAYNT